MSPLNHKSELSQFTNSTTTSIQSNEKQVNSSPEMTSLNNSNEENKASDNVPLQMSREMQQKLANLNIKSANNIQTPQSMAEKTNVSENPQESVKTEFKEEDQN